MNSKFEECCSEKFVAHWYTILFSNHLKDVACPTQAFTMTNKIELLGTQISCVMREILFQLPIEGYNSQIRIKNITISMKNY